MPSRRNLVAQQGEAFIKFTGNLTANPELRFLSSGAAVCNFTVVTSKRVKDGDEWKDGPASFWRCTAWRQMAENATELRKGDRVMVEGTVAQRKYETQDGETRYTTEVNVEEMGPSIRWKAAQVLRADRSSGASRPAPANDDPWGNDPWANPSKMPNANYAPPGGGFNDEPPFHHSPAIDQPNF